MAQFMARIFYKKWSWHLQLSHMLCILIELLILNFSEKNPIGIVVSIFLNCIMNLRVGCSHSKFSKIKPFYYSMCSCYWNLECVSATSTFTMLISLLHVANVFNFNYCILLGFFVCWCLGCSALYTYSHLNLPRAFFTSH